MPLQEGLAREQQHFLLAGVTSIINVGARKDRFPTAKPLRPEPNLEHHKSDRLQSRNITFTPYYFMFTTGQQSD
jgi:hypothetical protein